MAVEARIERRPVRVARRPWAGRRGDLGAAGEARVNQAPSGQLIHCREYFEYKRRCVFCDIIRQEVADEERLIRLTPHFALMVPYAARSPYEAWILPRRHACAYERDLTPETVTDLASLLRGYFGMLVGTQGDPSFEMVLYTAPNQAAKLLPNEWSTIAEDYHWHIEITPTPERLTRIGGIHVNETSPEDAARRLRDAWA